MQEQKDRRICRLLVFWVGLLAAFLPGCAGLERRTVMPGDKVDLHFTCRFPGGQVVASSYQDVGRDPALRKADFFLPREKNTPLLLTAGDPEEEWSALKGGGFEGEILSRLAHAVVGLEIGRTHPVEIQADTLPEKTRGEHIGKVARVRERVKELRLTPEEYRSKANRDPQVGQEFIMDPAIPGKVETVSDREVYIRFDAEPGKEVITPFGKGTLKETADKWQIVIDARRGNLVRSGWLLGRIIDVDDRAITIDYGHPFAGERLSCDVIVEAPDPGREAGKEAKHE